MTDRLIIALDGHDGAGKTTLAKELATSLQGVTIRPFAGVVGSELMDAGERKDLDQLIKIGNSAIKKAIGSVPGNVPIILDRGWMSVASFVPESDEFFALWHTWIPTVLCWADLSSTLSRLNTRFEESHEPLEWHAHYLAVYLELAKRSDSFILRTDLMNQAECINELLTWSKHIRLQRDK